MKDSERGHILCELLNETPLYDDEDLTPDCLGVGNLLFDILLPMVFDVNDKLLIGVIDINLF
jgi:hypothetical protein